MLELAVAMLLVVGTTGFIVVGLAGALPDERKVKREIAVRRVQRISSIVDGEARPGSVDDPDVVVEGEPVGVYHMFVDRRLDLVSVEGDRDLLEQLIAAAPRPLETVD